MYLSSLTSVVGPRSHYTPSNTTLLTKHVLLLGYGRIQDILMSLVINSWQNREKSKHKISTTLVGVCESEKFVDVIYMVEAIVTLAVTLEYHSGVVTSAHDQPHSYCYSG